MPTSATFVLVWSLLMSGDPPASRERAVRLRRQAEQHPTISEADVDAANALWAAALAEYERLLSAGPADAPERPRDLLVVADICRHLRFQGIDPERHRHRSWEAIQEVRQCQDLTDAESLSVLGKLTSASALLDGQVAEYAIALHYFDRAILAEADKPIHFINRGRTQYRAVAYGRHPDAELDSAEEDLRRVVDWGSARDVEKAEAHFYLGEIALFRQQHREAEGHFREAYQLARDRNIRWVLWSYYRRCQAVLDWAEHSADLPADRRLPDAIGHLTKIADFFEVNHHLRAESDWLRGLIHRLDNQPRRAAEALAKYLPGWPDAEPPLSTETRAEARTAVARLRFLIEWLDLAMRQPKSARLEKFTAAELERAASAVRRAADIRFGADVELRARALAVAGLTMAAAEERSPARDARRTEYRRAAISLFDQALDLLHPNYPGTWRFRLDLARLLYETDPQRAARLMLEAKATAPKSQWERAAEMFR